MAIGRIPEPGTGIPESIIAAKGDLIAGTANDTPGILTAGSNETRLVADSSTATGLKYVADTTNYAIAAKGDLLVGTGADTLAALTVGTNGHTLVADSSTATGLKWAAGASSGLTLISRVDFSNVATQDFDSVFTSSYRTYKIVIEKLFAATAADDLHLQFRYGSTTQTAAYYQRAFKYQTSVASLSTGGGSEVGLTDNCGTTADYTSAYIWVNGVGNTSEQASVNFNVTDQWGSFYIAGFCVLASNQTYTGFRLKSSSSNITGRVAIYGLAV